MVAVHYKRVREFFVGGSMADQIDRVGRVLQGTNANDAGEQQVRMCVCVLTGSLRITFE